MLCQCGTVVMWWYWCDVSGVTVVMNWCWCYVSGVTVVMSWCLCYVLGVTVVIIGTGGMSVVVLWP